MERKELTLELWSARDSAEEDRSLCIPLADFYSQISKAIERQPEAAKTAYVNVWVSGEYARAYLEVYFTRPETDEEAERRVSAAKATSERYAAEEEERERRQYERLKAKFEKREGG